MSYGGGGGGSTFHIQSMMLYGFVANHFTLTGFKMFLIFYSCIFFPTSFYKFFQINDIHEDTLSLKFYKKINCLGTGKSILTFAKLLQT